MIATCAKSKIFKTTSAMPPRLNLFGASRSLAIRARPSIAIRQPLVFRASVRRGLADEKKPANGPNQDVFGHVSEEATEGGITRETKLDLGQGTPVQEILEREGKGRENAAPTESVSFENLLPLSQLPGGPGGSHIVDPEEAPHKFGLPDLPLPSTSNLHHRYDPVVDQVTNLMMLHGKLSVAQRNMSYILNHLRTAPPPVLNPARPLLPGSPPPSHLPLNPVLYLTIAIDSVAPLLRIRSQKGAAGGGAALQIPVPLGLRQRRRTAIQWILQSAEKKRSRGSGRGQYAQKIAEEIISVVEGRSTVWEKRGLVHKTGTSARANLNVMKFRR